MKMYILIKEELPDDYAPLMSAHAALACYKRYESQDSMQAWVNGVFRKVICRVNTKEFEAAKAAGDFVALTESSLGGLDEYILAFSPRTDWPKNFRFFRKWTIQKD